MTFLKWFLSSPRRAGGSSKGDWSPFEAAPPEAGKSVSAETLAAWWVWASARSLGVWGHAPPSAFGRAAASPQTRQMRCWLSAAQATYHSFPSLPPTKTRSLRCTAFFPPKPLRWVSAGALLGEVIKLPFCIFSAFLCGGGIITLGVRFMPLKRWTPAGHGDVFAVFMPPQNSPCVG